MSKIKCKKYKKMYWKIWQNLGFTLGHFKHLQLTDPPPSKGFPNKLYENMGRNCGLSDLSFIFTNSPFEQNRCKFINKPTELFLIFKFKFVPIQLIKSKKKKWLASISQ